MVKKPQLTWGNKKCPKCGNLVVTHWAGFGWCSYVRCDYGLADKIRMSVPGIKEAAIQGLAAYGHRDKKESRTQGG